MINNLYKNFNRKERFKEIVDSVQFCNLCPRLCERRKVLSTANGNIESKVLFIAEAPGRLGADRTGIPLFGDRTGDNFETLLSNIGWQREQVFITNAILCNPKNENGNNGTPTKEEITNCSMYLSMVIALLNPEVVITLGMTALEAIKLLCIHDIKLRDDVAKLIPWNGINVFPLYHPAPRATIHRSLTKQRSDFMRLAKLVHPIDGLIKQKKLRRFKTQSLFPEENSLIQQVAQILLDLGGRMTYFKMTKLMYLIDFFALNKFGHTIVNDIYLRQVDGPWPPKLDKMLKKMEGYEIVRYFVHKIPMVAHGPSRRFKVQLDDKILETIVDVYKKYGDLGNSEIKTIVYRTEPMQFILQEEKKGKDMRNKPVLYKDKTIIQLKTSPPSRIQKSTEIE